MGLFRAWRSSGQAPSQASHPTRFVAWVGIVRHTSAYKRSSLFDRRGPVSIMSTLKGLLIAPGRRSGDPSAQHCPTEPSCCRHSSDDVFLRATGCCSAWARSLFQKEKRAWARSFRSFQVLNDAAFGGVGTLSLARRWVKPPDILGTVYRTKTCCACRHVDALAPHTKGNSGRRGYGAPRSSYGSARPVG